MTDNQLRIFAHHVTSIALANKNDRFTLYFGHNIIANIFIKDDDCFVNGTAVGNRQGAIAEYTRMVSDVLCETVPLGV